MISLNYQISLMDRSEVTRRKVNIIGINSTLHSWKKITQRIFYPKLKVQAILYKILCCVRSPKVETVPKICDWAKYQNRHSSKSIWVIKLSFCLNVSPMGESFWQKDSLIIMIFSQGANSLTLKAGLSYHVFK